MARDVVKPFSKSQYFPVMYMLNFPTICHKIEVEITNIKAAHFNAPLKKVRKIFTLIRIIKKYYNRFCGSIVLISEFIQNICGADTFYVNSCFKLP